MLLNSLDLAVCVTGSMAVVLIFWTDGYYEVVGEILQIVVVLFFVFLEGTAYATCVLSVTRALAVCKPFYEINGKAIVIATVCYFVYLLAVPTALYYGRVFDSFGHVRARMLQMSCSLSFVILIVIVCNISSVVALLKSERKMGTRKLSRANKQATITVVIISALFVFFNLAFASVVGCGSFHDCIPNDHVKWFLRLLIIPLNSALNPVVYFIRKRSMREYAKATSVQLWNSLSSASGRRSRAENSNTEPITTVCNPASSAEVANCNTEE